MYVLPDTLFYAMRRNAYICLVGLLLLTGCQWNLDKMLFDSPCVKPSAAIQVQANQLTIMASLAGKIGDVTTATWDFGDNSAAQTGETVTHSYTAIGTYAIKVVLTNLCKDRVEITQPATVDQQVPPQLETLDPANIATDKATLGLRFTSLGKSMTITEFGYCYSNTKPLPTVDDNARPLSGTATLATAYTAVQTGLTAGGVYTVWAYCKTDKTDPQYGLPKSFTIATPPAVAPVVETGAASSVGSTSAVLRMTLKSFTSPLYRVGVCYSRNATPDPGSDKIMFIQETGPALREYTFTTTDKATDPVNYATPLEPNTTYYYRAFGVTQQVNNVLGTEKLALGTISTFKTLTATTTTLPGVVIYAGNDNGTIYAFGGGGTQYWSRQLSASTTGSDPIVSSPAFANGRVYVAVRSSRKVFALNASDGTNAWAQPFSTTGDIQSSPTVVGNILYIGDSAGKLYLIDATTGAKIGEGSKTVGSIRSSPAVSGGLVVVGSDDNNVYAFNATDGTYKWAFPTTGQVRSSPTIVSDVVYVGGGDTKGATDDKNLYAINLSAGTIKWKYTTGGAVASSPKVVNGVVYVGSRDNYLYAVNADATGSLKWKSKVAAGDAFFSSPSISNNLVVVGSDDRKLYLFNQGDGTLFATFDDASKAVASNAFVSSSPVIYDGTIYFGFADYTGIGTAQNKSAFYGIELNGKVVKLNKSQNGPFWASPIVVDNGILVGNYPSISGAAQ